MRAASPSARDLHPGAGSPRRRPTKPCPGAGPLSGNWLFWLMGPVLATRRRPMPSSPPSSRAPLRLGGCAQLFRAYAAQSGETPLQLARSPPNSPGLHAPAERPTVPGRDSPTYRRGRVDRAPPMDHWPMRRSRTSCGAGRPELFTSSQITPLAGGNRHACANEALALIGHPYRARRPR